MLEGIVLEYLIDETESGIHGIERHPFIDQPALTVSILYLINKYCENKYTRRRSIDEASQQSTETKSCRKMDIASGRNFDLFEKKMPALAQLNLETFLLVYVKTPVIRILKKAILTKLFYLFVE